MKGPVLQQCAKYPPYPQHQSSLPTLRVAAGRGTNGGVAIAEAGRAAKLVALGQVEVAWLALVTLLALHMLLADTNAR